MFHICIYLRNWGVEGAMCKFLEFLDQHPQRNNLSKSATSDPILQRPHSAMVHWSIGPFVHWSIGTLVHWSIASLQPLDYWSMGPLVHWTIGPLDHCIHSKAEKFCGVCFSVTKKSAEKVRKSRHQNFATKVRKSIKSLKKHHWKAICIKI